MRITQITFMLGIFTAEGVFAESRENEIFGVIERHVGGASTSIGLDAVLNLNLGGDRRSQLSPAFMDVGSSCPATKRCGTPLGSVEEKRDSVDQRKQMGYDAATVQLLFPRMQ